MCKSYRRPFAVARGWRLDRVHFYTGVPSQSDNAFWHGFWANKLAVMGRRGVAVYSPPAGLPQQDDPSCRFRPVQLLSGEEKGIDVRLALDVLDAAHQMKFDVALIFSQDQDLSELASLIRQFAKFQDRCVLVNSNMG
jgi:uncharacterized LabA/DUF88 family protein